MEFSPTIDKSPPPKPDVRLIDRRVPRWVLLVLLCAVLAIRGRILLSHITSLTEDPDSYAQVAANVLEHSTLGLEEDIVGSIVPTALRPPLYPLLLAALGVQSIDPKAHLTGLLQLVMSMATVWATWRLAQAWGLPPGCAILAAALVAFDPILVNQSLQLMTETLATLLAALALLALARAGAANSFASALVAGATLGLAVLCRPTFMAWLVLVAVAFLVMAVPPRRILRALALLAAAAGPLVPWAARNHFSIGAPVLTTTHGGYTLLLANNPQFYEYLRSGAWGGVWRADGLKLGPPRQSHLRPNAWGPGGVRDELANDRAAYAEAWQNILAEPGMFAYSCLVRVGRLWGVLPHQIDANESATRHGLRFAIAIFYTLELALAAYGLWVARQKLLQLPWLWGTLLLLSFTAVHALYWTDLRMRAPLVPVVAVAAVYGAMLLAAPKRYATSLPHNA